MNEAVEYENVVCMVNVIAPNYSKTVAIGDDVNGVEVFSIQVKKNSDEFFILKAFDEEGNAILTLNVHKPIANEIYTKQIAIDGPAETK